MNSGVLPRPTELAHALVRKVVQAGDLAVDATVGNGHDTAFLAQLAGPTGKVVGFDIQQAALETTGRLVAEAELHCESHAGMAKRVPADSAAVVMFNLGYLPGGDHAVITTPEETLAGLSAALQVLRPGGLLTIVCYPGHPGGGGESEAVVAWAEGLGQNARVARYQMLATQQPAPFLIAVEKCGGSIRQA